MSYQSHFLRYAGFICEHNLFHFWYLLRIMRHTVQLKPNLQN